MVIKGKPIDRIKMIKRAVEKVKQKKKEDAEAEKAESVNELDFND